jgi:hypothetical protein
MKLIKTVVLGLGLLVVYPLVFLNAITVNSSVVQAKLADYIICFTNSLD